MKKSIADIKVFELLQNYAHATMGYVGRDVFNANDQIAADDKARDKTIYDHLDDDFVGKGGNIRRMPDDAIKTAIHELDRIWQEFGITPAVHIARKKGVKPKTDRLNAELKFREILKTNNRLRQIIQEKGFLGILFEPQIIDLLPCDPQKLSKWLQPPTKIENMKSTQEVAPPSAVKIPDSLRKGNIVIK